MVLGTRIGTNISPVPLGTDGIGRVANVNANGRSGRYGAPGDIAAAIGDRLRAVVHKHQRCLVVAFFPAIRGSIRRTCRRSVATGSRALATGCDTTSTCRQVAGRACPAGCDRTDVARGAAGGSVSTASYSVAAL